MAKTQKSCPFLTVNKRQNDQTMESQRTRQTSRRLQYQGGEWRDTRPGLYHLLKGNFFEIQFTPLPVQSISHSQICLGTDYKAYGTDGRGIT